MTRTKKPFTTTQLSSVRLYRVVFESFLPRFFACVIVVSFLLQPVARAKASEEGVPSSLPAESTVPTETAVTTDASPSSDTALSSDTSEDSAPAVTAEGSPSAELEEVSSPVDVSSTSGTSTVSVDTVPSPDVSPDTSGGEQVSPPADTSITESEPKGAEIVPDVSATIATSATSTVDLTVPVSTVMSDSQIQFNKSDCVSVADGSFYCQPKKAVPAATENGFFALPDSDGDLEIYLQKDGVMNQITHNTIDDAAPYYDAQSETLVWHRLIDDRYQIMSFDLTTGIETQLTHDSVNNMEPNRSGDYTVWQHWNGDNWDIQFYDGSDTKMLSTSLEHDVAPSIRGNLVVWNRLASDQSQTIELYDISSGEFTTIADTDGGVISNPRMVLVYESSFENGDVVTKGYDMQTGEIAELATVPVSVPDSIPPTDSTGETRALIQVKPGQKEDGEVIDGSLLKTTVSDPQPEPPLLATSTGMTSATTTATVASSSLLTLDLRIPTVDPIATTNDIVLDTFIATTTPE